MYLNNSLTLNTLTLMYDSRLEIVCIRNEYVAFIAEYPLQDTLNTISPTYLTMRDKSTIFGRSITIHAANISVLGDAQITTSGWALLEHNVVSATNSSICGAGGGHGGTGGACVSGLQGGTYGSLLLPTTPGGYGAGGSQLSPGGGVISLQATIMTVDGKISSNGGIVCPSGGG